MASNVACRHIDRHDRLNIIRKATPFINHLIVDFVTPLGEEVSAETMSKCSLALTSPRLPPRGRRAWNPVALGRKELAALTSAAPPWGGRACNPLEQPWAIISALTSGRPRRPTRACIPREAAIGAEQRSEGEKSPPDHLERFLIDHILNAIATEFIGKEARLTGNYPEESCSVDCADRAPKGGGQGADDQDSEGRKTDLNEYANGDTHEMIRNGEPTDITGKGNGITADVDLGTSVSTNLHVVTHLPEVRIGRHTEQPSRAEEAQWFNEMRLCYWDRINVDINFNMMELQGIGVEVNELTMNDCGNRPVGSADFLGLTKPEQSIRGRGSKERSSGGPRGRHQKETMEELDPPAMAATTRGVENGDLSMETIVLFGLVQVKLGACAMAMMEVTVGGTHTNCIETPSATVEAQRPPRVESSSSASWPRHGDGPAEKILGGAMGELKEKMKTVRSLKPGSGTASRSIAG